MLFICCGTTLCHPSIISRKPRSNNHNSILRPCILTRHVCTSRADRKAFTQNENAEDRACRGRARLAPQNSTYQDVKLILAPMEVLADRQFRAAIATIGGMHEAVHEFIRITLPKHELIHGVLRRRYDAKEMGFIPLAVQIMGGDPEAMGMAAAELVHRYGAHRVDLNCGCPSKRVNGRGAGATLLKTPESIFAIVSSMVEATRNSNAKISVKIRSGYESTTLFDENVRAITEAGANMLTVHPRTKVQAYSGGANWDFIARAKELCPESVEVVGNGDIIKADDALRMLDYTGCDHVMVGRGAVANPWIFWEIREALQRRCEENGEEDTEHMLRGRADRSFETESRFYDAYLRAAGGIDDHSMKKIHKMKIGRLKMMLGYSSSIREEEKQMLLRSNGGGDARTFLKEIKAVIAREHSLPATGVLS